MTWWQRYLGAMIALAGLLAGGLVAYGRMSQICTHVEQKADKREVDQIGTQLARIEGKLDAFILNHQK